MLPQQLLTVTSQSTEVITSQLAHRQRLKRSIEVMRTLKAQQGLFEITPTPDLRRGAEAEGQIMAFKRRAVTGQSLNNEIYRDLRRLCNRVRFKHQNVSLFRLVYTYETRSHLLALLI